MSTKAKKPDHIWENHEGFIIPANDPDRKSKVNMVNPVAQNVKMFSEYSSWEYRQSMFGENSLWYSNKVSNDIKKSCLMKCIDDDSLSTKNLSQKDKLCSKNCFFGAKRMYQLGEEVENKWNAVRLRGNDVKIV